jgi:hypothetical protein
MGVSSSLSGHHPSRKRRLAQDGLAGRLQISASLDDMTLTPSSSVSDAGRPTFALGSQQTPALPSKPGKFISGLASTAATALFGGEGPFRVTPDDEVAWRLAKPNATLGERPTLQYEVDVQNGTVQRVIGTTPRIGDSLLNAVSLGLKPTGEGLGAFFGGLSVAGNDNLSLGIQYQGALDAGGASPSVPAALLMTGAPGLKFGPAAEGKTVTVFRVEGAGNQRLFIDADGNVAIPEVLANKGRGAERNLYLNFGDGARAQEFLQQRLQQFPDNTIKTFQVPKSFADELRATAVKEVDRPFNPSSPVIADPTKAANQYGLSQQQIQQLRNAIIPGTGLQIRGVN